MAIEKERHIKKVSKNKCVSKPDTQAPYKQAISRRSSKTWRRKKKKKNNEKQNQHARPTQTLSQTSTPKPFDAEPFSVCISTIFNLDVLSKLPTFDEVVVEV